MRITRMVAAIVAAFMAAIVGLTMSPAASQAAQVDTSEVAVKAAAKKKPKHVVRYLQSGETKRDGIFYVKGRLVKAKGHRVYLQARSAKHPKYRTVTSVASTKSTGRFAIRFHGKCGAGYRIVIRQSPSYARTAIRIGKVRCY